MRRCLLGLLALSLLLATAAAIGSAKPTTRAKWRRYLGAWFSVRYPANFRVRPSLPANAGDGYDSAFFTSPDRKVEFYVFSPMWDGEPANIKLNAKTEGLVSSQTRHRDRTVLFAYGHKQVERTTTTWVTIRAREGRYTRSYVDTRVAYVEPGQDDSVTSRRTFGFKYANQKAYQKYRKQYERFRNSLEQYAD